MVFSYAQSHIGEEDYSAERRFACQEVQDCKKSNIKRYIDQSMSKSDSGNENLDNREPG